MYFTGLVVGLSIFLLIGLFHPLVVKAEYHLGKKKLKLIFGVISLASVTISLFTDLLLSIYLGCIGFSCFWAIFEADKQEKRRLERKNT
jgi:MFS superfamily sulfate permease-like transporter